MVRAIWIAALITGAMSQVDRSDAGPARVLDCHGPFQPSSGVDDLRKLFGSEAVETREIDVGEGMFETGTVVFPETRAQLEVLWTDTARQRIPRRMVVRGESSEWSTRDGIVLGTDLRTVERVNRKPFRLLGFAWDYGGTVMSWAGGRLERVEADDCRLGLRLRANSDQWNTVEYRQVIGDREFSSGHPAMQALNPRVYEISLGFQPANRR